MYTIHIQYALLPNATLPLISLRQNDKKNKLCALNFSLSFMTFIKNQGCGERPFWHLLLSDSGKKVPFSSPRRSPEISWRTFL